MALNSCPNHGFLSTEILLAMFRIILLLACLLAPLAAEVIDAFLGAEFSTEPHFRRRVQKLHELELRSAEMVIAERGKQ